MPDGRLGQVCGRPRSVGANSLFLCIVCVLAFCSNALAEVPPDELLRRALRQNPSIALARARLEDSEATYRAALAELGPQATGSFGVSHNDVRLDNGFPNEKTGSTSLGATNSSISLGIEDVVFSGGRLSAVVASASMDYRAAYQALEQSEVEAMGAILLADQDIRRDEQLLENQKASLKSLVDQMSAMERKFDLGAATIADRTQVAARVDLARTSVNNAVAQLAASEAAFVAIAGEAAGPVPIRWQMPALAPPDELVSQPVLADNPTLAPLRYGVEAACLRLLAAKTAYSPTVTLQSGMQTIPEEPYFSALYQRNVYVGLKLDVPLFTSGKTTAGVQHARALATEAILNLDVGRRQLVQKITQLEAQITAARASEVQLAAQVSEEEKAYAALQQSFAAGLTSTIDLLNAQAELFGARGNLIVERHDRAAFELALAQTQGQAGLAVDVLLNERPANKPITNVVGISLGLVGFADQVALQIEKRLIGRQCQ